MELQGFENKARPIGVLGVKISQGGEVIAHKTWDEECRRNVYSASKSVTSCAVGFAVQEGAGCLWRSGWWTPLPRICRRQSAKTWSAPRCGTC